LQEDETKSTAPKRPRTCFHSGGFCETLMEEWGLFLFEAGGNMEKWFSSLLKKQWGKKRATNKAGATRAENHLPRVCVS
jgi:hypothetical protein